MKRHLQSAFVLTLLLAPLPASAVTGREFLADPDAEANASYVSGVVNMLSQVLSAEGQKDKSACVKAWYESRRQDADPLHWALESYPDMPVEVTLYQLLRQECGFQTLKVE